VLAETETLCDRVAILHRGRVLEQGDVKGLLGSGVLEWEITVEGLPEAEAGRLRTEGHAVDVAQGVSVVRVREAEALQGILRALAKEEIFIHSVEPRRPSLEEHFVHAIQADTRSVP
jgi:ABC-type multidrug transport system ATPase subunit